MDIQNFQRDSDRLIFHNKAQLQILGTSVQMRKQSKNLSIISCTFNSQTYLTEMLESIKFQTVAPLEHIFVDAFSSDSTPSIIESYAKSVNYPVRTLVRSAKGISSAMNDGASIATGSYLMFLHSDDLLANHQVVGELEKYLKSPHLWLAGRCTYVDASGATIESAPKPNGNFKSLLKSNSISHPASVVSRKLLREQNYFDESLKFAMDYDLWLKLAKNKIEMTSLNFEISKFRIHAEGLSSANSLQLLREDLKVKLKYIESTPKRTLAIFRFLIGYLFIEFPATRRIYLKFKLFFTGS